ncbi:hypothetical protein AVEN_126955-1 [Araneus ventricosus]|uniref:Uncharacterized protein n=1 Tax=Araneus ventricosus TaxID=182803 RepID=A0A4Y2EF24_ARAVE|nr:hypothetical protein AVEN_126955-1 [Araneus ventricosus]
MEHLRLSVPQITFICNKLQGVQNILPTHHISCSSHLKAGIKINCPQKTSQRKVVCKTPVLHVLLTPLHRNERARHAHLPVRVQDNGDLYSLLISANIICKVTQEDCWPAGSEKPLLSKPYQ